MAVNRGYTVGGEVIKNKHADVYYRNAIDKEMAKFLTACFDELGAVYSTLPVFNAPDSPKPKPSPAQVRAVLRKFKGRNFDILLKNSKRIIQKWLKILKSAGNDSVKKVLTDVMGRAISIDYDKSYDELLKIAIERNVQLIKNTTTQTLTNIENIVYDSMTTGEGWNELQNKLYTQKHISRDRVKRIARDQTAKTNGAINQISQQQAGIKYYRWRTAEDERVSTGYGGHKQLNNKIYKWDDIEERQPVIDSYGHRGTPATRVNCRCIALPIVIAHGYKAVWSEEIKSYKIVKDKQI